MKYFSTKHGVLFFCVWMVAIVPVLAQPAGFIHLQSENSLAYQVRWNGNTYASNSSGYLVIPNVMPGEHSFIIGFAPEIAAPYVFKVTLSDKPRGFSIRQNIDNSWSLFDMIDFSLLNGMPFTAPKPAIPVITDEPIDKPATEVKPQTTPVITTKDSTIAAKPPKAGLHTTVKQPLAIQKIFDKAGNEGIDQVYTITRGTKIDTIALFIPIIRQEPPGQWAYLNQTALLLSESAKKANQPYLVRDINRANHAITKPASLK